MNIEKLIELLTNRISALNGALSTATAIGNVDEVIRLEIEILEVETTITKLKSLL
jgi:hypothetical protein